MSRALLIGCLGLLLACGRTGLLDEVDGGVVDGGRSDAGTSDAGSSDAGRSDAGLVRESPSFVFVAQAMGCADAGTEADLAPRAGEGLTVVRFSAQDECSGAGGEWLIGRELDAPRDLFLGGHACYFLPRVLQGATERLAVVRSSQTAALFETPVGWCITSADGGEPVRSDRVVRAWGVYQTEAGAREAALRLGGP